jgi:hypothetical protein
LVKGKIVLAKKNIEHFPRILSQQAGIGGTCASQSFASEKHRAPSLRG